MPEIIVKLGESIVHRYFFDKDILNIGRARDNDVVIENLAVSRNHARIRRVNGKYILSDLNSANGTFVNGVRVTKAEIMDNDIITVGKHNLHFLDTALSEEQVLSDAFGAERTMIIDRAPIGLLVVTKGKQKGQEFKINKYETFLGRSSRNDIQLHDWFVSRKHAVIIRQGSKFFVKDLGSWRKIILNGQLVKEAELSDNDEIQLGSTHLRFKVTTEYDVPRIEGRPPKELAFEEVGAAKAQRAETEEPETEFEEEVELEAAVAEQAGAEGEGAGVKTEDERAEVVAAEELEAEEKPAEEAPISAQETPMPTAVQEEERETPAEVAGVAAPVKETKRAKSGKRKKKVGRNKEIALWERALENRSSVIRKEAARVLKLLTGKDYDVQ